MCIFRPVSSGVQGGGLGAPIVGDISDCLSDKYVSLRLTPLFCGLPSPCIVDDATGDNVAKGDVIGFFFGLRFPSVSNCLESVSCLATFRRYIVLISCFSGEDNLSCSMWQLRIV